MDKTEKKLNPWFSMWTKPRETLQFIIDSELDYMALLLVIILNADKTLSNASSWGMGDDMGMSGILMVALLSGLILRYPCLCIASALISWTGKWLGGKASSQNILSAIA